MNTSTTAQLGSGQSSSADIDRLLRPYDLDDRVMHHEPGDKETVYLKINGADLRALRASLQPATPVEAARTRNPEVAAAVQQAIMKHPHFEWGACTAFGLANTAIDAYLAASGDAAQPSCCPCGTGEENCPGPDGKPLCATKAADAQVREVEGELVVTQYELAAARTALREIANIDHNCRSVDIARAALAMTSTPRETAWQPSYCALCDMEHQLHKDAQGFHHVIKGGRVACPQSRPPRETPHG